MLTFEEIKEYLSDKDTVTYGRCTSRNAEQYNIPWKAFDIYEEDIDDNNWYSADESILDSLTVTEIKIINNHRIVAVELRDYDISIPWGCDKINIQDAEDMIMEIFESLKYKNSKGMFMVFKDLNDLSDNAMIAVYGFPSWYHILRRNLDITDKKGVSYYDRLKNVEVYDDESFNHVRYIILDDDKNHTTSKIFKEVVDAKGC